MRFKVLLMSIIFVVVILFGCTSPVQDKADDAVEKNNPSLCRTLEEEYDVKKCYVLVADKMNDPNVCLQATDRNDCITKFSVEKGNIKYCDMSADEVAKYACVASVTGDQTGRAIEDLIADWRNSGTIEKCKEQCKKSESNCRQGHFNTEETAKAECLSSYTPGSDDYYWCVDAAEKTRSNSCLDCYEERLDCAKRCDNAGK
ncbi:MAG: hypothetical protein ABH983_05785 [Candidatus Micrarchaeota archaeon]